MNQKNFFFEEEAPVAGEQAFRVAPDPRQLPGSMLVTDQDTIRKIVAAQLAERKQSGDAV